MNFVTIDFETATNRRNSVCAVGICVVENGEITDTFYSLIQPPNNNYSQYCINVHGITPGLTENARLFPDIWNEIDKRIKNKLIIAHNAKSMDEKCLFSSLDLYEIPYKHSDYKFICSLELSKWFLSYSKSYKLENLCHLFSIDFDKNKSHNALYDAEKVAELLLFYGKHFSLDENLRPVKPEPTKKQIVTKEMRQRSKIDSKDLKPNFEIEDKTHLFYKKKIVFTGKFYMFPERRIIGEWIKEVGGDNNLSISKETDYVIVGEAPGPVKMKQIEEFKTKTLSEQDFISLFPNKKL